MGFQIHFIACSETIRTGQGSGASPSVWLSLVVILLTALTVLAPLAMSFVDPWEDIHEEQNADSFLDDTLNGCNDAHLDEPMPYVELIACHGPSQRSNLGTTSLQLRRCS
jgi:hypothetical protein